MSDANSRPLVGRTLVMSGGSRGIGLAIATAVGSHGANVVLLAKTDTPDPRLPGTVHTAVEQIEAAGGNAVAVVGDVRRDEDVQRAVDTAVGRFGGIDVVVNNASAIELVSTEELPVKRFDLMQQINVRGTFLLTQASLPHLRKSPAGRVLTLAPPLNMSPRWLGAHPAYTMTKYSMTLLSMGWAAEYAETDLAFACLWPETFIATAAMARFHGDEGLAAARSPQIMADAAVEILSRKPGEVTGRCFLDADVLRESGMADLSSYGGGENPPLDLFVD
ncbi:short chain dehydrogenase [Nocardioides gansuensis]|uniref:Short chain dehydrogenase n=1 Tax=Nocardioides gansuensis TaxID=2138300 RepID=A0A2T8F4H9_9ACTN|nr:NAD(P)-dependent oxidoreductase [Nocardioides gansuensis]PVG80589.1 short chain dehydrogenase [Nocardioides gansuensis]